MLDMVSGGPPGTECFGVGPGRPGETKTLAYLEAQMKAEGLQPAGDPGKDGKRGWTQAVPLGRFEIAGPVKASFTAAGQAQTVSQGGEVAIRAPQTNVGAVD